MKRRLLRAIAFGVAGAVLMAQAAVAGYACPSMSGAVADEVSVEATAADRGAETIAVVDFDAPALCTEHCKLGQQSSQAANLAFPAAVLTVLYTASPLPTGASWQARAIDWLTAIVAASPPHAILHCVRRT